MREKARMLLQTQEHGNENEATRMALDLLKNCMDALFTLEGEVKKGGKILKPFPKNLFPMVDDEILLLDGILDNAIVGYAVREPIAPLAVYDFEMVMEELVETQGYSEAKALGYFAQEVVGRYTGEKNPIILFRSV